MLTEKKIVIFDMDGVLIDSIKNMEISWNYVKKKYNLKVPFSEYKRYIGLPFEVILKKIGINEKINHIKINYNKCSKNKFEKIKLYPKVNNVLKYLRDKNFLIAIITSKDKSRTKKLSSLFNVKFKYIYSPNKKFKPKPFPDQILHILKKEKIMKKNCFYIGDMSIDALFAKKAGVKFILTEYGYETKKVKSYLKIKKFTDLKKIF